jgi:hypothetical protein
MTAFRVVLIAVALWVVGGLLAAFWSGYGAYVMVGLDLLGLVWLIVGLAFVLHRRHARAASA